MKVRGLQCGLALSCGLLAASAQGATLETRAEMPFAEADHVVYSLANGAPRLPFKSLLTNHGGGVIAHPKAIFVFWGPSFNNAASADFSYARTLQAYRNQLGGTAASGAAGTIVYTIQPYPSCSGCKVTGWTAVQNQEHFVFHETAEAATDPVNGWWDNTTGEEVMDKCAWSPAPFLSGGYAYQAVWSNQDNGCVVAR
jgi:hypothetical protein